MERKDKGRAGVQLSSALALCVLFMLVECEARTFYVSSSRGSDSYSIDQAQSSATPWSSLGQVNAFLSSSIIGLPGDTILFETGNTFVGSLTLTQKSQVTIGSFSGSSLSPPIFTGALSSSFSWSLSKGSIYVTSVSSEFESVAAVYLDGVRLNLARWPNQPLTAVDVVSTPTFSRVTKGGGDVWFVDSANTKPSGYWNGATVKWRSSDYTYDISVVKKHKRSGKGSKLTIDKNIDVVGVFQTGFGYWLENLLSELDAPGEWYYDNLQKRLYLWAPGSDNPSSHLVEAIVYTNGIKVSESNQVSISGIQFTKYAQSGVWIEGESNSGNTVQSCNFNLIEQFGIYFDSTSTTVMLNTITNVFGMGVNADGSNSVIAQNTITNIGLVRAVCGKLNCGIGIATSPQSTANIIKQNVLLNLGYIGIRFDGTQHTIDSNVVTKCTLILSDGGGIYAWGDYSKSSQLLNNIVYECYGNTDTCAPETDPIAHCLYFDDYVSSMRAAGNTLFNCYSSSLFLHDCSFVIVENNLLFNSTKTQLVVTEQFKKGATHDNVIRNNVVYSGSVAEKLADEGNELGGSTDRFATYDNNFICSPYDRVPINSWYSDLGSRQSGTQECGLVNQVQFNVASYLTTSLVPGYFASETSLQWAQFPDKIKATLYTGTICTQQCLKISPCCYKPTQEVIVQSGDFSVAVGQVYWVNGVIASAQNTDSAWFTIRDRNNYEDLTENLQIGLSRTSNTWTAFQGLMTILKSSASARLDFSTVVSQGDVYLQYVELKLVQVNPVAKETVLLNAQSTTSTIVLPVSGHYLDPVSNTVVTSVILDPYSGRLVFNQNT